MGAAAKSGMSPLSYLWGIPMAWVVFWTVQRTFVTFFMSADFAKKDFADTMIPPGTDPAVESGFFEVIDRFMSPADLKYYTLRLHIATSFVMMFICMAQMMPFIRRRYMKLHRKLGYAYVALLVIFSLEVAFTTYVIGVALPSTAIVVSDTLGLICMIGGTAGGIYFAKQHKIRAHWACMLINVAGLFHIPVQRLYWLILSQSKYMAPYEDFQDWVNKPLDAGIWLSWGTVTATALAVIVLQGPSKTVAAKKLA